VQGDAYRETTGNKGPATVQSRILSYPGRMSFSPDGKMLANSDSNRNRALVLDPHSGNIIYEVGSGAKVCTTTT
jgi:hypothetical protein